MTGHDLAKLLPPEEDGMGSDGAQWVHPAMRLDALFMCARCEAGALTDKEGRHPKSKLKTRAGQRPVWRAMSCTAVSRHVCPGLEKTACKGSINDNMSPECQTAADRDGLRTSHDSVVQLTDRPASQKGLELQRFAY